METHSWHAASSPDTQHRNDKLNKSLKDDLACVQYKVIDCPEPSRIEEASWMGGETSSSPVALIQPLPQDDLNELEASQTY